MAERKSPVMAIIGKNGPQEYETGDGLPLDLGGGGSGGVKLYKHEITMNAINYMYIINVLSTESEPFINIAISNFMSNVMLLNGQVYETIIGTRYYGCIIEVLYDESRRGYFPIISVASNYSIVSGENISGAETVAGDIVTEWNG